MESKKVETSVKNEALIQKRRDQLVKAAVKLFIDNGFHRTTTREIAKASGFSIGTLYEYIRSKEDVLYLVCDDIYNQVKRRVSENIDQKGDGLERVKAAVTGYLHVVDELQEEILVMYQEAKELSKDSLPYVLNKEFDMAKIFEDILTEAADEGFFKLNQEEKAFYAHHLLVSCQMWAFRRWAFQRRMPVKTFAEYLLQTLFNGLSLKETAGNVKRSSGLVRKGQEHAGNHL